MPFENRAYGCFCENVGNLVLGPDREQLDENGGDLAPDEVLSKLKVLVTSRNRYCCGHNSACVIIFIDFNGRLWFDT